MEKLLASPKNNYLLMAHPINMHEEVLLWLSELEFCNIELQFLKKLLHKHLFTTPSKKKLNAYYALELKLKKFHESNFKKMHNAVLLHEHHLSEMDKDKILPGNMSIAKEHAKHKLGVNAFMGSVKKIKSELFSFVEKQLRDKRKISNGFKEGTLTL